MLQFSVSNRISSKFKFNLLYILLARASFRLGVTFIFVVFWYPNLATSLLLLFWFPFRCFTNQGCCSNIPVEAFASFLSLLFLVLQFYGYTLYMKRFLLSVSNILTLTLSKWDQGCAAREGSIVQEIKKLYLFGRKTIHPGLNRDDWNQSHALIWTKVTYHRAVIQKTWPRHIVNKQHQWK